MIEDACAAEDVLQIAWDLMQTGPSSCARAKRLKLQERTGQR
jgi:hypothetical protein